jgi:DNA topoisomerase-1
MYGAETQRLLPTDLGRITNDFLVAHFPSILSYDFTAHEEEQFDRIAVGKADWTKTVDSFYKTFKPLLSSISSGKVPGRELGLDPATGQPVIAKISKIGPCVQLGDAATDKPKFASLKKGQSVFTITLAEALDLFRTALPINLGEFEGKDIVVGEGKFGPYVHYDKSFISIPRGKDPLSLTKEEAVQLIIEKRESSTPLKQWGNIQVLPGKYGTYIHTPEGNYQLPKDLSPESLTEEKVREIIAKNEPIKPGKRTFKRKSAK